MLKKFKSLFVIEDGDTPKDDPQSKSVKQEAKKQDPTTEKPTPFVTDVKGQIQSKFQEVLFGALEANNQEGFDYMEFKDSLVSLAKIQLDEAKRYQSAFAMAQTMGATKEKILSSAKEYLRVLGNEETKFLEALNAQREKNLTGKQKEIKNLEQVIQDKQAQIEKLKAELESHRGQIKTLEDEINGASEKLAQTASDFQATYLSILGQIQSDVNNIETHL